MKFKIKVIMRSSKNQLSCYMTLFGNFAPYDLHALRRMVCGGFVVNSIAMTFKIPEKKKKTVAKLVVLISRIKWNSGFHNFGCHRSGSYFTSFYWTTCTWQLNPDKDGIAPLFSFLPALLKELKFWHSNIGSFKGYCKVHLGMNLNSS